MEAAPQGAAQVGQLRWSPSAGSPRSPPTPGGHCALTHQAPAGPAPRRQAPPLTRPRRPTKLATPRAAVAPPRRLAPACLDCRRARGREGDVRRVRAFLPFATQPVPPHVAPTSRAVPLTLPHGDIWVYKTSRTRVTGASGKHLAL